jgi:SAM-dependent methyltransferase
LSVLKRITSKCAHSYAQILTAPKHGNVRQDKFAAWREGNPQGTFKQFYAERAIEVIRTGKPHPTLGANVTPEGRQAARSIFDTLISLGLRRSDSLVDYGCGTLRLGRLLIEYLDAERYVGLDIDDRIIQAGYKMLPPELIAKKAPFFDVISPNRIRLVGATRPRWVIAAEVIHHVAPFELNEFFHDISALVRCGAVAIISFTMRDKIERLSNYSWGYSFEYLQDAASRSGMVAEKITSVSRQSLIALREASVSSDRA